jgi:hypothetical protein
MFCKSLFGLLSFFIWSSCCLSFFDLQIRISPLLSSNSSSSSTLKFKCYYYQKSPDIRNTYRQHDDQMKKDKRPNNDLQNITEKSKDRATRTLFRCYGRLSSSCPTSGTRRDTLARNQMISHE